MDNFSIIIPTYNRPAHLSRIISYYDSFGENFRVIVADSSREEFKGDNKGIVSSASNLNILYLDNYSPETHPFQKFSDAVNHVEKKYCVFCADDDFIVPGGIEASLAFLESNTDYAVAHGRYISFKVVNGSGNTQRYHWNFAYLPISIELPDPAARLELQLADYTLPTVYGVHRSSILKKIYAEVLKSGVDLHMFGELLATSLTVIFGKTKYMDTFYAARSEQTAGSGPGWPSVKDAIIEGTYDEKYPAFRKCLTSHLMEKTDMNSEEAGLIVDKAMTGYLKKFIARETLGLPRTKKRAVLDSIHLPEWIDKTIMQSYVTSYRAVKKFSLYRIFIARPAFTRSRYRDDFNKIRRYVLSSSE